jgi:hypothetical protein
MHLNKHIERRFPLVVSLCVAGVAWQHHWFDPVPAQFSNLLQAVINVAAIAVGFIATAKGILISSHDREIVRNLSAAKQLGALIDYFIAATLWCICLCLLSAYLLVFDLKESSVLARVLPIGWLFILSGSVCACVRVIYLFNLILRSIFK